MDYEAARRRVSHRIVDACSRPASDLGRSCCCIWRKIFGVRFRSMLWNRVQSAILKLNCRHIGWIAESSIGDVLNSKYMTLCSVPVVASSSTAQLVIDSVDVGVAKVRSRTEVPVPFL